METKECVECGSKNTYFTKKTKFCRACGHEEIRELKSGDKKDDTD